jgi:hypothetical protein
MSTIIYESSFIAQWNNLLSWDQIRQYHVGTAEAGLELI